MQFFHSFYSLGYSSIVLVITAFFVTALVYNSFGFHKKGPVAKSMLMVIMIALFVVTTNFLAKERKIMMDAIRDEGGLKRTQER